MLASRLGGFDELKVADLYAGSGALGLEALSRGAATCLFVDKDREALAALRRNIEMLGAGERSEVLAGSAERLGSGRKFDLVLADPPYSPGSGDMVIKAISEAEWLRPGGWLAIETDRHERVSPCRFELAAERVVGRAKIHLLYSPSESR